MVRDIIVKYKQLYLKRVNIHQNKHWQRLNELVYSQ